MAGTIMTLNRYGGRVLDFKKQLVIVDSMFLSTYNGTITLNHPYEVGLELLEVYVNGQLLSVGGGYSEIDEYTIELHLPLEETDEVYIKINENRYSSGGGMAISQENIFELLNRVTMAQRGVIMGIGDAEYEYNASGFISKETLNGPEGYTRELIYNSLDEIAKEVITYKGKVYTKTYEYDLSNGRLLRSSVSVTP